MEISIEEIQTILEALRQVYGPGYSENHKVAHLQGKLSILLEAKSRVKATAEKE